VGEFERKGNALRTRINRCTDRSERRGLRERAKEGISVAIAQEIKV